MDWLDVSCALDDILSGKLRDPDKCREVFAEADRIYVYEIQRLAGFNQKAVQAQMRFLKGWKGSSFTL